MADKDRRRLLSTIGAFSGLGLVGLGKGVLVNVASDPVVDFVWSFDKEARIEGQTREIIEVLFGKAALLRPPAVFAGEGNPLKTDDSGNPLGLSHFLKLASEQFSNLISSAAGLPHRAPDIQDTIVEYRTDMESFVLGGPPSNSAAREILGYDTVEVVHYEDGKAKRSMMPKRWNDFALPQLRWYQDYGISGWGVFEDETPRAAQRYDNGKLVKRAVYRMYDRRTGHYIYPTVKHGMLYEEWLTIVKIEYQGVLKVLLGGFHGHSSEAFVKGNAQFIWNLEKLLERTEGIPEFQVIVPVTLSHNMYSGHMVTEGKLEWDSAQLDVIKSRG